MRQPVPFGKYLLLDRISVGGMAEVFKAKSYGVEGFEKIIAIKRILPTMGEDRDFIKMFIDEAKIAGQLAHANICQIFELGRIDGSHFIAMEYIWGKDLLQIQNRLRKIKQPMPIAMACFTIAKVLEGLDYAHRKRDPLGRPLEIVHRDCSPQNVLVSYEGEVKVIDFGIAKATSRNSRTMAGVLKGKFGYMSPEQVRGLPLDRRSDIFALGTMLYECLTGDRLFQGETDFSTLEKVRNVDIRPPRELNPNIPLAVEAVILKALAKDVDERYQWCSEMLADLQAFLMSQDAVFTAKSLSSWLKEVFTTEIDRERQLLEQYKRVGRDGLIAGLPSAEAKVDVIETLGEAAPAEGDPTVLGSPNFDDLEQAAGAAPEVGPAPGSPAARGGPVAAEEDDGTGDFGEEAPTEIFGEIDHGANPALPAAGGPPGAPRAPTAGQQPQTRPPKPPPTHRPPSGRAPTSRGEASQPMAALPGLPPAPGQQPHHPGMNAPGQAGAPAPQDPGFVPAASTPQPGFAVQNYANPANAGAPYQQYGQPPAPGYPPQPPPVDGQPVGQPGAYAGQAGSQPIALGTPAAMSVTPSQPMNGLPQLNPGNQGQGRTLLGAAAPVGLPNYSQGYPPPQQPYGPYPGHPQMQQPMHPSQMQQPMHPSQMQQPYPQMPGFQGSPYPQVPHNPYAQPNPYNAQSGPYNAPVPPLEQIAPLESKKRSSIVRDVAIGVGIAALVLSGFLAVKYLVLDSDSTPDPASSATSSLAKLRISITGGSTAELFVDDKKIATVGDKQEIPVSSGPHKVKLVGPGGAGCEQPMKLDPGKATTLECALGPAAPPGPGSGDASATTPGSGAAGGPPAPAGSDGATPADHPAADKADKPDKPDKSDRMPPEDSRPSGKVSATPAGEVPSKGTSQPVDRPGDKTATTSGDKAGDKQPDKAADKADKVKPAKPPVEDDPLGRIQGGIKPGDKKPDEPAPKAASTSTSPGDPKGYAAITSTPSARIAIDGKDTGLSTPIGGHALPVQPGKHRITFVIGGDKFSFSVVIKAGETTALHKDLR